MTLLPNRINFPNVLILSGSGRKVGKTCFGTSIIQTFSSFPIIAVKISSHTHPKSYPMHEIYSETGFTIWKEIQYSEKDSGRYLKADAACVYYIETNESSVFNAFLKVHQLHRDQLFLIETASLLKYINPSVAVFIKSISDVVAENKQVYLHRSDVVLNQNDIAFNHPEKIITIENNQWKIK